MFNTFFKFNIISPKHTLFCYCSLHNISRQYSKNIFTKSNNLFFINKSNININNNIKLNSLLNRNISNQNKNNISNKSGLYYICSIGVLVIGLTYAAVPLYRMFCQATSYGGTITHSDDPEKVAKMKKIANRPIKITFNADVGSNMRWNFKPQQNEITVYPGETALAFYTAKNPTNVPVIGISTYNVVPFEAGQYFNKIQCFCFEEQQLNPHEEVDMPVFFYIDPEFVEDSKMEDVDNIILSYTFFESKEGFTIPIPSYAMLKNH